MTKIGDSQAKVLALLMDAGLSLQEIQFKLSWKKLATCKVVDSLEDRFLVERSYTVPAYYLVGDWKDKLTPNCIAKVDRVRQQKASFKKEETVPLEQPAVGEKILLSSDDEVARMYRRLQEL